MNCVVSVQWVEEQETSLLIVLRRGQRVGEDEDQDEEGSPDSFAQVLASAQHLFEIETVNHSLGEENGVVVDHHKDMM